MLTPAVLCRERARKYGWMSARVSAIKAWHRLRLSAALWCPKCDVFGGDEPRRNAAIPIQSHTHTRATIHVTQVYVCTDMYICTRTHMQSVNMHIHTHEMQVHEPVCTPCTSHLSLSLSLCVCVCVQMYTHENRGPRTCHISLSPSLPLFPSLSLSLSLSLYRYIHIYHTGPRTCH